MNFFFTIFFFALIQNILATKNIKGHVHCYNGEVMESGEVELWCPTNSLFNIFVGPNRLIKNKFIVKNQFYFNNVVTNALTDCYYIIKYKCRDNCWERHQYPHDGYTLKIFINLIKTQCV